MTTLDKYLISSLKSLDQWRPRRPARPERQPHLTRKADSLSKPFLNPGSLPDARVEETSSTSQILGWPPTLAAILNDLPEPPPFAALLGACEDGLPFLFDLTNPAPGAILVVGQAASGKTRLFQSILYSASQLNSPDQIIFSVIAGQPEEYLNLGEFAHCQEIIPVEDQAALDLIVNLAETVEARKRDRLLNPAIILLIDDLAALLPFLDEQAYARLYWLIRHGPRYQVWVLAALESDQAEQVDPRFLSAFRTRLFGYMHNERLARRLAGDESIATRDLEKGRQFYVPYGDEWLRFWICALQESTNQNRLIQ